MDFPLNCTYFNGLYPGIIILDLIHEVQGQYIMESAKFYCSKRLIENRLFTCLYVRVVVRTW